VIVHLRDRLRAGDVWVEGSRAYRQFEDYLLPPATFAVLRAEGRLALALPAGVLADAFDRRLLLLAIQVFLVAVASVLTFLSASNELTPGMLLVLTFLDGAGAGVTAPTWQALIPDVIDRSQLRSAAVLGAVSVNVGRAVGPALAGLLIAVVGVAVVDHHELVALAGERVRTGWPVHYSPGLHDPLRGQELEVTPDDVSIEERKGAANVTRDLRRGRVLHAAEGRELREFVGVGERSVNARGAGIQRDLLVDCLGGLRDVLGGAMLPRLPGMQGKRRGPQQGGQRQRELAEHPPGEPPHEQLSLITN